jgi:hypothetical protein
MLTINSCSRTIDLNDVISDAAETFCEKARKEGDHYNQSRIADAMENFILDLLESFQNGGLADAANYSWTRCNLSDMLHQRIKLVEPLQLLTADELLHLEDQPIAA